MQFPFLIAKNCFPPQTNWMHTTWSLSGAQTCESTTGGKTLHATCCTVISHPQLVNQAPQKRMISPTRIFQKCSLLPKSHALFCNQTMMMLAFKWHACCHAKGQGNIIELHHNIDDAEKCDAQCLQNDCSLVSLVHLRPFKACILSERVQGAQV